MTMAASIQVLGSRLVAFACAERPLALHRAQAAEATGIAELLTMRAVPEPGRPTASLERVLRSVRDGIERSDDALFSITDSERLVGALWCRATEGADGAVRCHLREIVLTPELRGRGLGSEILRHLEQSVSEAGFGELSLNFMARNSRVRTFYERLGFDVIGLDVETALTDHTHETGAGAKVALGRAEDGEALVELLLAADQPRDFERPALGGRGLEADVRAALSGDSHHVGLVVENARVVAAYWFELVPHRITANPIGFGLAFHAGPGPRTQREARARALLDWALGRARTHVASELYACLWDRDVELLQVFEAVGFRVGRYKMSRRIS